MLPPVTMRLSWFPCALLPLLVACGEVFSAESDQDSGGSPDDSSANSGGAPSTGGTGGTTNPSGGTGSDSSGGTQNLGTDPLLYLSFDDGSTLLKDSSTWERQAAFQGTGYAPGDRPRTSGTSSALTLDNQANTAIVFEDQASLHPSSALTLAVWIHPTGLTDTSSMGIISKREGYGISTDFALHLYADDPGAIADTASRLCVDIDGVESRAYSTATIATDTWYHVAVTFDGSAAQEERVAVYVNGSLDSTHAEASSTITYHASALAIGDLPNGGGHFQGTLDEVMIFPRSLSAAEIADLYAAQK